MHQRKTVVISETEYRRLKKANEVEAELLASIAKSLEAIKSGRVKRWE